MPEVLVKVGVVLMLFGRENVLSLSEARIGIERNNQQTSPVVLVVRGAARRFREPCSRFNMVQQRYGKYACMKQWAYRSGYLKPRRIFGVGIQMTTDGYTYGFASGTCDKTYPFAMFTFGATNPFGADRREHSITAMRHELDHLIGAKDLSEPCSLMYKNALACVSPDRIIELSALSVDQIRRCQAKGW